MNKNFLQYFWKIFVYNRKNVNQKIPPTRLMYLVGDCHRLFVYSHFANDNLSNKVSWYDYKRNQDNI